MSLVSNAPGRFVTRQNHVALRLRVPDYMFRALPVSWILKADTETLERTPGPTARDLYLSVPCSQLDG
jgi:hypothetical protein